MPDLNKKFNELIKSRNWDQLSKILAKASKDELSSSKRAQGWLVLGTYYSGRNELPEAIVAYNKARVSSPDDPVLLDHLIGALAKLYHINHDILSIDDVILLKEIFERIINYYKIHKPIFSRSVFTGQQLIMALENHKGIAPPTGNKKLTDKITTIYNALYSDMSIEEIRAEFARIMAPHFRERIEKMEKDSDNDDSTPQADEKPKKKKRRGSKK